MSIEGTHPHFTSPLRWHSRLEAARAQAEAEGKVIFLQHGRRVCSGTRALVERTLAKEEIAEMIADRFIALASDADHPEAEVEAMLSTLPRREPTPVCVYLTAEGRVLLSTAGGRPPAVLLNDMLQAWARR